jgi:hypothetical protein
MAAGLEAVAAALPMAVKKTGTGWFTVDGTFKLEPEALRTSPVGEKYGTLLEKLDEVVTMRAVHLEQERTAKAQAAALAEQQPGRPPRIRPPWRPPRISPPSPCTTRRTCA